MAESMNYTHEEAISYAKKMGLPTTFEHGTKRHWTYDRRGTGRTTRMLKHGVELANSGKKVVIVAHNTEHKRQLMRVYWDMAKEYDMVDRIMNNTHFWYTDSYVFVWHSGMKPKLQGMDPESIVLVDHYAIANYFKDIFDEYHRFD